MVPPRSDRISRVPPYSRTIRFSTRKGLSPTKARLSRRFRFLSYSHWPGPRSLATTSGVSVDVLSSGYLDVSVPRVCSLAGTPYGVGSPIRKFTDQSLFAAPHDLSQRITSFIASCRQGIHRMPLRHLITLIINAHPSTCSRTFKDDPLCATAFGYLSALTPKTKVRSHKRSSVACHPQAKQPGYLLHPGASKLQNKPIID